MGVRKGNDPIGPFQLRAYNSRRSEDDFVHLLKSVCRIGTTQLAMLAGVLAIAAPVRAQVVLYDNGPDAETGYYQVNFGAATTNSFVLPRAAAVSNFTLTLYDVDDRNLPERLKWTLTTQPLGGTVLGSGMVNLNRLQPPYLTRFLFFAWKVGFQIPNLDLPAGTYWIQLQDVATTWLTLAYWAQSTGASEAYYAQAGSGSNGLAEQAVSESFSVMGAWADAAP
jgi:hypothetical protein